MLNKFFIKNITASFVLLYCLIIGISKAQAISFQEAMEASYKKPAVVLVYAEWADNYLQYLNNFRALKNEFGDKLNYVELNIASPDTKDFNSRYHIYPNLPYVLMYKDNGRVSRYIPRNCAMTDLCMIPKIQQFIER